MRISSIRHQTGDLIHPVVCGDRRGVLRGCWRLSPTNSASRAWPVATVMLGILVLVGSGGCSFEYKESTTPEAEVVTSDAGNSAAGKPDSGKPAEVARTSGQGSATPASKVQDDDAENRSTDVMESTPARNPGNQVAGNAASNGVNVDSPEGVVATSPSAASPQSPPGAAVPQVAKRPAAKRDLLPIESTSRRAVVRENGLEVITFDDLILGMQPDMVFRDFLLTDRARELDGKKVRLVGYMDGGVSQTKGIQEFVLLQNTECKFGPGGQADHLVRVLMKDGATADYSLNALQVEGVLKINPFNGPDGNTWSVYDLVGEQVKTIRRK